MGNPWVYDELTFKILVTIGNQFSFKNVSPCSEFLHKSHCNCFQYFLPNDGFLGPILKAPKFKKITIFDFEQAKNV